MKIRYQIPDKEILLARNFMNAFIAVQMLPEIEQDVALIRARHELKLALNASSLHEDIDSALWTLHDHTEDDPENITDAIHDSEIGNMCTQDELNEIQDEIDRDEWEARRYGDDRAQHTLSNAQMGL